MQSVVEYGLANAAAATALALVALLIGFVVRRPAVRHALWVLVLLRLLLPPVWTVSWPAPEPEVLPAQVNQEPPPPASDVPEMAHWTYVPPAAEADSGSPTPQEEAPQIQSETPRVFDWSFVFPLLVGVWVAGTAFVFGRSAWRIVRFRRALVDASPAPAELQTQADGIAQALGLRTRPRILLVNGRIWPSLWMPSVSTRRAKILVPAGLLPLLDEGQRATVLAHELAHLRRGDPWVRWLELIACGLYWWHPLLWWFRRQLREAEEACCDLCVVAALGRRDYAMALVETAVFLSGPDPAPSPALCSGAGPVRNLERRVTMIMKATWPARLTRFGLATVLAVGGLGLAFGPALAQDRKDPPREGGKEEKRSPEREKGREDFRRDKDGPPREGDRPRASEEVEKLRDELNAARRAAREAMARADEIEAKLRSVEGRGERPREGARDPMSKERVGPREGPLSREPGLREMQQQLAEMQRVIEEMRREMRRDRGPDVENPRLERIPRVPEKGLREIPAPPKAPIPPGPPKR